VQNLTHFAAMGRAGSPALQIADEVAIDNGTRI